MHKRSFDVATLPQRVNGLSKKRYFSILLPAGDTFGHGRETRSDAQALLEWKSKVVNSTLDAKDSREACRVRKGSTAVLRRCIISLYSLGGILLAGFREVNSERIWPVAGMRGLRAG